MTTKKALAARDIFVDPDTGKPADFYFAGEGYKVPYDLVGADGKPMQVRDNAGNPKVSPVSNKPLYHKGHMIFRIIQRFDKNHVACSQYALENQDMYEFADSGKLILEKGEPKKNLDGWARYKQILALSEDEAHHKLFHGKEAFVLSIELPADAKMREDVLRQKLEGTEQEKTAIKQQLAETQKLLEKLQKDAADKNGGKGDKGGSSDPK